jgi:hypothetical protein
MAVEEKSVWFALMKPWREVVALGLTKAYELLFGVGGIEATDSGVASIF